MSTDWNVHCIDCKDTHRFNDANHCEREMLALCKHADSIAALADAMRDPNLGYLRLELGSYGAVDPTWFRDHLGHQLLPINEYGALLGQCPEYVKCGSCGVSNHKCELSADHEGPCATVKVPTPEKSR